MSELVYQVVFPEQTIQSRPFSGDPDEARQIIKEEVNRYIDEHMTSFRVPEDVLDKPTASVV